MKEKYDYYYGQEAEQFSFYRIPKILFTDTRFSKLSCEAKVLYGLMLDRMGLSMKNKWLDEQDRVYIYFKLEDVMTYLNCGHDKGVKLLAELDSVSGIGLIERQRQGMGKPNRIYVKNYMSEEPEESGEPKESGIPEKAQEPQQGQESKKQTSEKQTSDNQKSILRDTRTFGFGKVEVYPSENQKSIVRKNGSTDFGKPDSNNTNINNTDFSNNDSIYPSIYLDGEQQGDMERLDQMDGYKKLIAENIGYPVLCEEYGKDRVEELLELITEIVCTSKKVIRISGQDWPAEVVKSRFLKLDLMHLQYVFDCLNKNTTQVHNIRAYLLSMLYNAPVTISSYYTARVNYDLYGQ